MPANAHDLRQLRGVLRLRQIRCEQAERIHEHSRKALDQSQRLLELALRQQRATLARLGERQCAGALLDPAQHEQRLLAQQAGQLHIDDRRHATAEALAAQEQALADLLAAKVAEEVATKAFERLATALRQHTEQRERLDIFDSWLPRKQPHGL